MRFAHHLRLSLAALLLCLLVPLTAGAQDVVQINYQGFLTDDAGSPLTNGYAMVFTIYCVTGGSLGSEGHTYVTVTEGGFFVILGSVADLPSSLFGDEPRYLGIRVGSDPEIAPRTLLTSVPAAASARRLTGAIETEVGTSNLLRIHPPQGEIHPCINPAPAHPCARRIRPPRMAEVQKMQEQFSVRPSMDIMV